MTSWETPWMLVSSCVIALSMLSLIASGDPLRTSSHSNSELPLGNPCPDPEVIAPCKCIFNATHGIDMDCSNVTSEEELRRVFNNDFTFTDFRLFTIMNNQNIMSLREGDLGSVSFTDIKIVATSMIEIQVEALKGSFQTLVNLDIYDNHLKFVPDISEFTRLQYVQAHNNEIYQFPIESSAQLLGLNLSFNHIDDVPEDAIVAMKSLENLMLIGNSLTEIHPNTFTRNEKLSLLHLASNRLTTIPDDAITLHGESSMLLLGDNQITNLSYKAVSSVNGLLQVQNNNLTELPEEVFRPLLEDSVEVISYGNPFKCGCDIAWLVFNPDLLDRLSLVEFNKCSNGELFIDLDPEEYRVMCPSSTTMTPENTAEFTTTTTRRY